LHRKSFDILYSPRHFESTSKKPTPEKAKKKEMLKEVFIKRMDKVLYGAVLVKI
jgi:hypothetical protein